MWNWKKIGLLLTAFVILVLVFVAGIYIGVGLPAESKIARVLGKAPPTPLRESVDFSPFWQAWSIVESKYVDIDKIKRQEMVYGAISGLLKSLGDPYSVFFPPKENSAFQSQIKGEFEGIGMEVGMRKGIVTVIAPLKGTPAEKAGIKAGDMILKIGDKDTSDLTIEEAVSLIRGPKGTKIKLTLVHSGDDSSTNIEVERAVINIPVIETSSEKITQSNPKTGENKTQDLGDIFVLRLYNFSENSSSDFRNALREMQDKKKTKLILDLRNNPGGYLDAAVDMASWFLPQGDVVVQEDFGKGNVTLHKSVGYNIFKKLPMVILVNQGSASASEILAGALRDHNIAKLIGEKTFGKGSVQELVPLANNTSVKITIAKWLTPNGISISEKGLDPDIEVKTTKEEYESGKDPVMDKAIAILKNM